MRRARKIFVSRITVRLNSVPFDMMRHDNCVPDTEEDSAKLERIAIRGDAPEDYIVAFRRYSMMADRPAKRWDSYNCKVLKVEEIE